MKVLVFIDHDIICRHFVLNGALAPLVEAADVRFVFPEDGSKRFKLDPAALPLGAPFDLLAIDEERLQTWRWRLFADQLKWRPGKHERAIRHMRRYTLGWKAALLLQLAGLPIFSSLFRRMTARRLQAHPAKALSALLDRERPDVVFHPTVLEGGFINDIIFECEKRGIPTVLAMNSWDNPSTKRAMVGKPDRVLVWGRQTYDHAVRFMGIKPDHVVPFGAAQFDIFRTEQRGDRTQFCRSHDINPSHRIILFAGSNARTDEFGTLTALDNAIEQGVLADTAIVYRPHPWGGGGRDGKRLADAKFRHVVIDRTMRSYIDALGRGESGLRLPDYRDTHDLLSSVDAVVSPLSTILLEGMLHRLPVIVFAPEDESGSQLLANNLPMLHFDEFLNLPDMVVARSVDELVASIPQISDPIAGPALGRKMNEAAVWFVTPFERPWRERIVEFLRGCAEAKELSTARVPD
ncbi:MAG: hypothetical protein K9G60_00010 [Pseudolabrys sp.]|nr:hypothetical protein [Pseudolabrys sp.]